MQITLMVMCQKGWRLENWGGAMEKLELILGGAGWWASGAGPGWLPICQFSGFGGTVWMTDGTDFGWSSLVGQWGWARMAPYEGYGFEVFGFGPICKLEK